MDKPNAEKGKIELVQDLIRESSQKSMLKQKKDEYERDSVSLCNVFGSKVYKEGMLKLQGKIGQLVRSVKEIEKQLEVRR